MVSAEEINTNQNSLKDDEEEKKKSFKNMSMKERIVYYVNEVVTIEPLICCLVVGKVMRGPALTNLHFEKACKVNAGFNDTVCDAILNGSYLKMNFREQNNEVQSYMTHMRSWEVPVSSVVPVLLVLFLGSYSDRHQIRKPFLLIPLLGDMVALIGIFLNIIYMYEWPLEALVVADNIIPSLFGAEKLLIMVSYAYIADVSSPSMRTVRMAVIPIFLSFCIPIVQAISGVLFAAVGYIPVLSISFFFFVVAFFYGVFRVKELGPAKKEYNKNLLKDIFVIKNVSETFKLLVKKGEQRTNLICILVLCYIHTTVNTGEHSAFFMFTQTAYQWTVVDFSYFRTATTILHSVGLTVGVPLFARVLHLNDLTIIIIAYLDSILVSSIFVVVQSPIGLYTGLAFSVLKPPGHAATRSQLTKYVTRDDMAKALSLNTIVSAIAATVSAQIYHEGIYEHTRKTFPQAFFLFGIAMHSLGVAMLIWMYYREKRNQKSDEAPINENEMHTFEEQDEKNLEVYIIENQIIGLQSESNCNKDPIIEILKADEMEKEKQIIALQMEINCNEGLIKNLLNKNEIEEDKLKIESQTESNCNDAPTKEIVKEEKEIEKQINSLEMEIQITHM